MREPGPESGAAGTDRRFDRATGLPPLDPGQQDDDQRSTAALPRPAAPPAAPRPAPPRYGSPSAQPTTAIPRNPPPGRYQPAGYDGAGYTGATPAAGAADRGYQRIESSGEQPPVGPSWAPQRPYPEHVDLPPQSPPSDGRSRDTAGRYSERNDGWTAAAGDGTPGNRGRRLPGQHDQGSDGDRRVEPTGHLPAGSAPPRYREPGSDAGDASGDNRAGYADSYRAGPDVGHDRPGRGYGRAAVPGSHPYGDAAPRPHPYGDAAPGPHPYDDAAPGSHPSGVGMAGPGAETSGRGEPSIRRPAPRGSHLPPYSEPLVSGSAAPPPLSPPGMRIPRKLTVTRVAALRSRELTSRGVQMFHRATTADGADKSGLTSLTYAVMANYAVDAALAVALAGTLFFAAATAESTGRVLLYLVITVAPFAVIAPFIGPMLDRLQNGRRLALALSSFGRALLALAMAFNFSHFNPWVIYPCALGNLVLSKAFGVLKAALTPRVLPAQITLVKTNSRLTTFGMIAGGVAGAVAAGLSKIAGSPGALFLTAACAVAGGVLCLRIPAWVESTEGEVPVSPTSGAVGSGRPTKSFPQIVTATLWANSMIRVETGFLALFIAFVVKSQYPAPQHSAFTQLLLLGVVGGAAGVGGFVGNTMGARLTLSAPETISIFALVAVLVSTVVAVLVPGLTTAALVGFVGSTASALAKVSLDSVIQHHLPEESRASAFGISESVLQLGWVFGGVVGLLLGGVWTFGHASVYAIGFGTITVLLVIGLVQSYLVRSGRSMVPELLPVVRRRRRRAGGGTGTRGRRTGTGPASPGPPNIAALPAVDADPPRRRPRRAGDER